MESSPKFDEEYRSLKINGMNTSVQECPILSVIIPTYNRAEFLKRCLQTVLVSGIKNIEVLVADNDSHDHTLFMGCIGNKGTRSGNLSLQNSDLVISIGCRLSVSTTGHEYSTFAREAKIIVVDIDPEENKKNTVRIDHFINADAGKFLKKLQKIKSPDSAEWLKKCRYWKEKYPTCLPEYAKDKGRINLYYFIDVLSKKMKSDSVVVGDAGSAVYVPPQCLRIKKGQRYITSGCQAEMGYTIPACIGISVARKKGEVIGITGDGSFQLNIQELQTIVHHDLPIKIFVWNNNGYLSIRATQTKFFEGRLMGADPTSGVSFPSLRKIARAYGIKYFKASKSNKLADVIE
ncbi:MAG TPA: thiamine pyrophosphate-dependent enzyme, partial [bacterium]